MDKLTKVAGTIAIVAATNIFQAVPELNGTAAKLCPPGLNNECIFRTSRFYEGHQNSRAAGQFELTALSSSTSHVSASFTAHMDT